MGQTWSSSEVQSDQIGGGEVSSAADWSSIDISGTISTDWKYRGGVLGPDGHIYMVPHGANNIGHFDPSSGSFATIGIGFSGSGKYSGGVLARDGHIYLVPYHADKIGVFNPWTKAFSRVQVYLGGSSKYSAGVLARNGHIYFVPYTANNIGDFDPTAKTFTTIGISALISSDPNVGGGTDKYDGGVLADDGHIYFAPHKADNIGDFDPATGLFDTIDISGISVASINSKYRGAVLAPNGHIYMMPHTGSAHIGDFDPSTKAFAIITTVFGGKDFSGGVLAPNGRIYLVPYEDSMGEFDPATGQTSKFAVTSVWGRHSGGVLGPDGHIYMVPFSADEIGILGQRAATNSFRLDACVCDSGYASPPLALSYTHSGDSHGGTPGGLYHASVLADGRVYMAPYHTKFVAIVDPANVAGVRLHKLDELPTYFVSALLAPDGRIWMTPSRTSYKKMGVLDPRGLMQGSQHTVYRGITIDWGTEDLVFCDAVLANNGRIYMIPRHADVIGDFNIADESFQTIAISSTAIAVGGHRPCHEHLDESLGAVVHSPV